MRPVFGGIGVALITIFDESGELDVRATVEHAQRLVGLGVGAVVVAGSTGEALSLSLEERADLLKAVRAELSDVPVIAGTGAPSTREAVHLTSQAVDLGADAVLVLSPFRSDRCVPYYEKIRKAAGATPVIAYHWPAMSPPGIPIDVLPELPVDGCKDSSGDAERLLVTLTKWGGPLYVGSSALLALAGGAGCAGAIVSLANADPEGCIRAFSGDFKAQLELIPGHLAAVSDFPRGIKELASRRFGTSVSARMG
ncbi:MAG: dihydrodipicolinate synthase family protein [Actinomycetota bacterium]|nr:dihydrodipicolinate synthase family protein [Actinomycetota bacterium]